MAKYSSVTSAGLIAYHAERGTTIAANDTINNAALLVASEYIDARYRTMFPGEKTGLRAQEREFPRTAAYDVYGYAIPTDEIPRELDAAIYEIAAIQIATPGALWVNATMGEAIKSVSVSGAVAITYAGASNVFDLQLSIPVVDAILAPILTGQGNISSLSGSAIRI